MTDPANGYIVISWWNAKDHGSQGDYSFEHYTDIDDALAAYREIESGEWPRAREIAIVCARNGIPTGVRIHPHTGSPMSSSQMAEQLERAAAEGLAAQGGPIT